MFDLIGSVSPLSFLLAVLSVKSNRMIGKSVAVTPKQSGLQLFHTIISHEARTWEPFVNMFVLVVKKTSTFYESRGLLTGR